MGVTRGGAESKGCQRGQSAEGRKARKALDVAQMGESAYIFLIHSQPVRPFHLPSPATHYPPVTPTAPSLNECLPECPQALLAKRAHVIRIAVHSPQHTLQATHSKCPPRYALLTRVPSGKIPHTLHTPPLSTLQATHIGKLRRRAADDLAAREAVGGGQLRGVLVFCHFFKYWSFSSVCLSNRRLLCPMRGVYGGSSQEGADGEGWGVIEGIGWATGASSSVSANIENNKQGIHDNS